MRILLFFCCSILSLPLWAQSKNWSKAQLTQDVDSFFFALEHSHPDLTLYCSQTEYEQAKNCLYNSLNDSLNTAQFALAIGRLFKTLKDSHSQVSYSFLWNQHLANGGCVLPIRKRGNYVVKGDLARLQPGDSLISINGIAISQIDDWAKDLALIEGDAFVSEKRMSDMLFSLTTALFVIKTNAEMEIILSRKTLAGDSLLTQKCPTFNEKEWKRQVRKKTVKDPPAVLFKVMNSHTAVLTVSTFAPKKFISYHHHIKRAFRKIRQVGIDTLILDLRGNAGGLSTEVEYLYSFIDAKGYNTPSNIVGRRSHISDQKYRFLNKACVQWWVEHFLRNQEDIYNYVQLRKQPLFAIDTVYFHQPMRQKKWVYNKTVILWADGLTASAGVDFTHHFHETSRGEHWGESVMGPMTGTFGNTFPYTLPHSRLIVNISTIRYNYNNSFHYSADPIQPHVQIEWKRSNFTQQEDPYWIYFKKKSKLRTP